MPGRTVTAKQDDVIGVLFGQFFQKDVHARCVTIRHNKKVSIARQRLYRSVSISILPNMVAWHTGTDTFLTPAVFRLVNPAKTSFILEHQADFFAPVDNFQLLDCGVNFFEAAISSSLAFLGCLLRGMTFRHPWRCSTK